MRLNVAVALGACLVAIIASSLAWTRAAQLRDAVEESMELRNELRTIESKMSIVETAIKRIDRAKFGGPFLTAWSPAGEGKSLRFDTPNDGLYLVVSPRCPWCLPLLRNLDAVEASLGGPIILLADDVRGVNRFFELEGIESQHALLEPSGGWWSIGIPKQVTPLWFRYTDGELTEFGLGSPDEGLATAWTSLAR